MAKLLVIAAVLGVLCSLLLSRFFSALPFPYDAAQSKPFSKKHIHLSPGGSHEPLHDLYHQTNAHDNLAWLSSVRRLFEGQIEGVESVAILPHSGALLMLDKYGYMHMAFPDHKDDTNKTTKDPATANYVLNPSDKWTKFYIGPGRPLGVHVLENGKDVLVCDSLKGLIQVNLKERSITILANIVNDGRVINYANDLDVGTASGKVYFTSSTAGVVGWNNNEGTAGFYDTLVASVLDFFHGVPSGRLLVYDPATRQTEMLLDNLYYANGVALAADESFVLVVETFGYRVLRLWLQDTAVNNKVIRRKGQVEVFLDRLPGTPDGLARSKLDPDSFWICLVSKISPIGKLAPYPLMRQLVAHILVPLIHKIDLLGSTSAIKVKAEGGESAAATATVLLDPGSTALKSISGVTEYEGSLFFGSLSGNYVSVMPLKDDNNEL